MLRIEYFWGTWLEPVDLDVTFTCHVLDWIRKSPRVRPSPKKANWENCHISSRKISHCCSIRHPYSYHPNVQTAYMLCIAYWGMSWIDPDVTSTCHVLDWIGKSPQCTISPKTENYGNPYMIKLSKFKVKGTKVQTCIWKCAKGQTCKLEGAKVQSYIWQGAKGQTYKFKELVYQLNTVLYNNSLIIVPTIAFKFAGLTFCTLPFAALYFCTLEFAALTFCILQFMLLHPWVWILIICHVWIAIENFHISSIVHDLIRIVGPNTFSCELNINFETVCTTISLYK